MCDSDQASIGYFNRHLELMRELGQSADYEPADNIETFFMKIVEGEHRHEGQTAI